MIETSYMPKGKDMRHMSLVAMKICNDGIVAFADSKASRKDENNNIFEDKMRSKIRKVFRNEHFVVVTSGNNEIVTKDGLTFIESYIIEILPDVTSPQDFAFKFFEKIEGDGYQYEFIFGYKNFQNKYAVQRYVINNQGIFPSKVQNNEQVLYFQGDKRYCDMLKQMRFDKYHTIEEAEKEIKRLFSYMIHLFNHYDAYNSVGLPIHVEVFK